ncbi:MAG TPA: GNAT family N-acetyltransferase [Rhizomicrobium sp.]|jgi:RimJ/RimL family protein N-acetyltransferase|nr:GNAT family N-acetyltransferase [Rhizomicrobium sp.]
MVPQLETERLIMRAWCADDFETYAEFMADPEVARFIAPAPMTRADAWRSLAVSIGHWALRGYGTWAVTQKSDGALVGRVGMINPEGWPALEVGWTLGQPYWGKGYATESAAAAMRYAFLTQPVDRVISSIDPENVASQKVAQRLGETRGERDNVTIGGKDFPVDLWFITRAEWQRRNAA